ncbi:MAG: hypothetical protein HY513_05325 [Candidatus Aenigmarchaeota archaeon]|nr:hypothetical protein [Candidatus Aenigmarchaeota archaeon]
MHRKIPHIGDYHPGMPSFRDQYRYTNSDIVVLAYDRMFAFDEPKYITGGIATQFYIPPDARRGSSDLDISFACRLNWANFQGLRCQYFCSDNHVSIIPGCIVNTAKKNHSFVMHVCNCRIDSEDLFFFNIDMPRHSAGYHARMAGSFEREYENAHEYDNGSVVLKILDPADIIARKIWRIRNYHNEGVKIHAQPDLSEHLDKIWRQREVYTMQRLSGSNFGSNLARTELRFLCDLYDIRTLFAHADVDMEYLGQAMDEAQARGAKREMLEKLMKRLSPEARQKL